MRSFSRWLLAAALLAVLVPAARADEWVSLFDGKTLDGWTVRGGTAAYKVDDGCIVGTTTSSRINTFLCSKDYTDFVLELEVKLEDTRLNSGVQVRSHVYGQDAGGRAGIVFGPQCEIALNSSRSAGRFYDEARRGVWIAPIKPEAEDCFKDGQWNKYRIVVQGNRYRSWINGVAASDFTDDHDTKGFIGLQVHAVAPGQGPYSVRWRNIRIHELKPGESASD
jgi:hypothetical protein